MSLLPLISLIKHGLRKRFLDQVPEVTMNAGVRGHKNTVYPISDFGLGCMCTFWQAFCSLVIAKAARTGPVKSFLYYLL